MRFGSGVGLRKLLKQNIKRQQESYYFYIGIKSNNYFNFEVSFEALYPATSHSQIPLCEFFNIAHNGFKKKRMGRLMSIKKYLVVCLIGSWLCPVNLCAQEQPRANLETLYGKVTFTDPLLLSLSTHPAFTRLRQIDVAGPSRYLRTMPSYSMFEHAMGVLSLLIKFNRPLDEQTASLLAFVAHSVFGDFGSFMFDTPGRDMFELDTQKDFIKRTSLDKILEKYKFPTDKWDPLQTRYPSINGKAPELSAQSIDETLRMAFAYKMIDRPGITRLLNDLKFENGKWYFLSQQAASKFAKIAMYFAENFWGAPVTYMVNRWMGQAMKRAIDMGRMNINQIRFGIDEGILKTLIALRDPQINSLLKKASDPYKFFRVVYVGGYESKFTPPFKALDPLVMDGGTLKALSQMDPEFEKDFIRLRDKMAQGFKVISTQPSLLQRSGDLREDDVPLVPQGYEPASMARGF